MRNKMVGGGGAARVERLEPRRLMSGSVIIAGGDSLAAGADALDAWIEQPLAGGVIQRRIGNRLVADRLEAAPARRARGVGGLDIVLKKGPLLQANAAASAAFERAAEFYESILTDPVTVVFDAELAPLPQNVIGATGPVMYLADNVSDFNAVRSAMINDRAADESIVASLPTLAQFLMYLPNDATNPFSFGGLSITRANLLALGFDPAGLLGPTSAYDPGVPIDGEIIFSTAFPFDFDGSDGVSSELMDFYAVAVHEIGHALGFTSDVDAVDFMLSRPAVPRSVYPTTLDYFRLEPGQGQSAFSTSPRVLVPGSFIANQVTYDGGVFNPAGIPIPGLTVGDVPMSTGVDFGDGHQGSHWKDDAITGHYIGLLDPNLGDGEQRFILRPDHRALGLIGWDLVPFDATAPTVAPPQFLFETAHQIEFTFSEDVGDSLNTIDLVVERLDPGGGTFAASSVSYDSIANTATFTFATPLPDGNYRATLSGAGVHDLLGNAPASDTTLPLFFVLGGDANRDRKVDIADLRVLTANWQQGAGTFSQGNFDYVGGVDASDLAELSRRWQQSLLPPPSPARPTVASSLRSQRMKALVLDA